MLHLTLIAVGSLKEPYLRDACAEYEKRLGAFCRVEIVQLREARLPEDPGEGEIAAALLDEGKRILAAMPQRAYRAALCVEGKQLSSEELAGKLAEIAGSHGSLCLAIGSSHGLSEEVKQACDFRWSVSRLTFPHQLMRVILLETVYRSLSILNGRKYHK